MADFLVRQGTQNTWIPTGTGSTKLNITSLAASAGKSGGAYDLGAEFSSLYSFKLTTKFGVAPTKGTVVRVLLAWSDDNVDFAADQAGDDAVAEDELPQFHELLPLVADDSTAVHRLFGFFRPMGRYVMPIIFNSADQSLSGTNGDHELTITPLTGTAAVE